MSPHPNCVIQLIPWTPWCYMWGWHLLLECKCWFSSSGALSKSCYYSCFVKSSHKTRAQVLSGLGASSSKELHFGVCFACPLTCPAQSRNLNKTLVQLSAHNFPTPQVKPQGQFNWNWHKFRQIKIILNMIKKTHSCLWRKIINFQKILLHVLEPPGAALISAETIYGDFYSFIYSFIK